MVLVKLGNRLIGEGLKECVEGIRTFLAVAGCCEVFLIAGHGSPSFDLIIDYVNLYELKQRVADMTTSL